MITFQGRNGGKPPRPGRASRFLDSDTGFAGWSLQIPGGRDVVTPCVDGGRVLLGGGFGSHEFYAFDADDGRLLWGRRTADDGPTAAVVSDGHVTFNTESCTVCVLRADTGETAWERWLGDPLLAQPAVGAGTVFMAWPSRGDHLLGAFSLLEGAPVWTAPLPADVITAPVFAEGALYASTFDGSVHCFDPHSGKLRWSRPMRATSAPWVWCGQVYVSQREEGEAAPHAEPAESLARVSARVRAKMGASKRAHYLRSKRGTLYHAADLQQDADVGFASAPAAAKLDFAESLLGATTVSRAWSFQGSRPCVWEGRAYAVVGDELAATSLTSGEELWRWSARIDDGERSLSPPAVTNGRVYAGSRDGRVLCWDADSGELRWSVDLGAPVAWQPVVSGGWVFAGGAHGRLVAFATGDPADDGWPMWGGGPGHNGGPAHAAEAGEERSSGGEGEEFGTGGTILGE